MPYRPHPTHNKELKHFARNLRTYATAEENCLWYEFLSKYTPRFRRQATVQNYILDFYCPAVKLAIELDGNQHYDEDHMRYDEIRTVMLAKLGIEVIRFPNAGVRDNLQTICAEIEKAVKKRMQDIEPQ